MSQSEPLVVTPRYKLVGAYLNSTVLDAVTSLLKHIRPDGKTEILIEVVRDGEYAEVYGTIVPRKREGWFRRLLRLFSRD